VHHNTATLLSANCMCSQPRVLVSKDLHPSISLFSEAVRFNLDLLGAIIYL
jgi:hypothetical protein